MDKTLTLLSFLVFIAFLGGIVYSHADESISQSASTTKAQSEISSYVRSVSLLKSF